MRSICAGKAELKRQLKANARGYKKALEGQKIDVPHKLQPIKQDNVTLRTEERLRKHNLYMQEKEQRIRSKEERLRKEKEDTKRHQRSAFKTVQK